MRRLFRRFLDALSLASAVLCVCVAAMWFVTPWQSLVVARTRGTTLYTLMAGDGWVRASVQRDAPGQRWADEAGFHSTDSFDFVMVRFMLVNEGIRSQWGWGLPRVRPNPWGGAVIVPQWMLVLAFGVLPAARGVAWVRRRRVTSGAGFDVGPAGTR